MVQKSSSPIRVVLLDYGGVLAEEGFREGLYAAARDNGLDQAAFHRAGLDAIYDTGYVVGRGSEAEFWQALRRRFALRGGNSELTRCILERFVLRPRMIAVVRALRRQGIVCAILSDQTDWLDRLERRDHFYKEFDKVYTSYHLGKGKRDPSLFDDVVQDLAVAPGQALFVDDDPGNVRRAADRGLHALLYKSEDDFIDRLGALLGGIVSEHTAK